MGWIGVSDAQDALTSADAAHAVPRGAAVADAGTRSDQQSAGDQHRPAGGEDDVRAALARQQPPGDAAHRMVAS